MPRLLTKTSLGIASGALTLLGSIRYTNNLETQYPIHVPPRHSRLWIPNETDPKRKVYVPDVSPCTFYARIPKSAFPEPFRIEEARNLWPRAFFKGTLMSWEGKAAYRSNYSFRR
ncbi:hypothetical protein BDZ89DRAFT_1057985 [Hymenopellis radicata]|nr:hypothetical protein BDZ89DRAFT_1057985 [Hymenopellis radicata]